jgi:hypothetical protein
MLADAAYVFYASLNFHYALQLDPVKDEEEEGMPTSPAAAAASTQQPSSTSCSSSTGCNSSTPARSPPRELDIEEGRAGAS